MSYNDKLIRDSLKLYNTVSISLKNELIDNKNKLSKGPKAWFNKNNDKQRLVSLKKLIDIRVKFYDIIVMEGAVKSINDINHFIEIDRLKIKLDILIKKTKKYRIREDNKYNMTINKKNDEFKKKKKLLLNQITLIL